MSKQESVYSRTKEKQQPSLMQRMEMIESVIDLLLDSLADLTPAEFEYFKRSIYLIQHKPYSVIPWKQLNTADLQETVFLIVKNYGQLSVDLTKNVLKKMKLNAVLQRLSDGSLTPQKKPQAGDLYAAIHKAAKVSAVNEALLEALNELDVMELANFKWFLQVTCLHRALPHIPWSQLENATLAKTVDLIEKACGELSVEVAREVFTDMGKSYLESEISSGLKEEHPLEEYWPALHEEVQLMVSCIDGLRDALNDLSSEDFKHFKSYLIHLIPSQGLLLPTYMLMEADQQEIVLLMVLRYGGNAVEMVKNILKVLKLSLPHVKHSVEAYTPTLIHKVATVAAVKQLLWKSLRGLTVKELTKLKRSVQVNASQRNLPDTLQKFNDTITKTNIVSSMMEEFGFLSLELIRDGFQDIGRTDLALKLPQGSLPFKAQFQGASGRVEPVISGSMKETTPPAKHDMVPILLEALWELSLTELNHFKQMLQITVKRIDIPTITPSDMEMADRIEIADLIVQRCGDQSLDVTLEVFERMNRHELVQMLHHRSQWPIVQNQGPSGRVKLAISGSMKETTPPAEHSMFPIILGTLRELSLSELNHFKQILQITVKKRDIPTITPSDMEMADRIEIADFILQRCCDQSLDVTLEVFERMNRPELVQMLHHRSPWPIVQFQGASVREEPVISGSMKETTPPAKHDMFPILLGTLRELSLSELNHFKQILQHSVKRRDIPTIKPFDMEMADRIEIADLIVQRCGDQSLDVTLEVFERMNRHDLMLMLQHHRCQWPFVFWIGPSGRLKPVIRRSLKETTPPAKHGMFPILLEALWELSLSELNHFKQILQNRLNRIDILTITPSDMEMADIFEIADLIVQRCGDQSLDVTLEVYERMNRPDLVQMLHHRSPWPIGPKKDVRSMELGGCATSGQDVSDWTKLEPEVNHTDVKDVPSYCLQSEDGQFECSVSGLRWVSQKRVSFRYQFCSWEGHIEWMESLGYAPAGPLLDITVTAGEFHEVYLPHWVCLEDNPEILNKFAVLHVNDSGDEVENASEVTATHVKLNEPIFSPRAVLIRAGFPVKANCNVLIYKTNTSFLTLHVYVVPRDPGLKKALDQMNVSYGYRSIRKPHPERSLKMKNWFTLTTDMDGAEVSPKELKLRYESTTPNFFEVYMKDPDADFRLMLTPQKEDQPVWDCAVRKDEYQRTGHLQGQHFVDKYRNSLIARVNIVGPILDHLLSEGVLHKEEYDQISSLPTSQDKIRRLYDGPLHARGSRGKETFYSVLQENEACLVEELQMMES